MIKFNKYRIVLILAVLLTTAIFLNACESQPDNNSKGLNPSPFPSPTAIITSTPAPLEEPTSTPVQPPSELSGQLQVSFIDVGQADSILIKANGANMLIDAGNNADGGLVVSYLKEQGITKLDYVIGTHPHEDHIGGLDDVINSFDIGTMIMPKVSNNTRTFEDVLDAISSKGLKVTTPVSGTSYSLGDATFTILAPNSASYKDLNDYSVVIKLTYGKNSFLFEGDAESISESEMISKGYDLKADVLKIGHHGSTSSTTQSFLDSVKPTYAVISVGVGNSYGHPAQSTISRLSNSGIQIFRTDELSTIIATSDGNTIKFNKKASPIQPNAPPVISEKATNSSSATTTEKYIGNINSKKFHRPTCKSLPYEKNRVYLDTREQAINAGYIPCKNCDP